MDQSGNHIRQEHAGEFLRRLRKHEQAAFHELVDQFSQPLFRVAYSMVGNAADAEDVVQETFTAAFAGIGRFRGQSTLRTWLMQILVRQSARVQRSRGRRMTIGIEDSDQPVHDPAEAADSKLDVIEMLQKLSPEHREVIVLRELQAMSYEEMAQTLKIPRGTVESRLHRARQELREKFGDRF
ncbi:MAG TPA: sigma-70 family RNA polymerase sigma factor [Tepidisphaeraceae bacterium]|jgi:RNA polymerase sigma-70 factor (ECF subfamily)|nr:sigma-70 family RNA polymerase sigma factor [Tepidisphaeraceae bacterium]